MAGGKLGDVALISSIAGSIRANHFHNKDWHLCYLINGSFLYHWNKVGDTRRNEILKIIPGQMVFTPPKTIHKFQFLEDSNFITIARLSRKKANYDRDTKPKLLIDDE